MRLHCSWKLGKSLVTGNNAEQTGVTVGMGSFGIYQLTNAHNNPREIWWNQNLIVCLFRERQIRVECGFDRRFFPVFAV